MKIKKIISFALILSFMFALSSCSKGDGKNFLFRYAIQSDPQNLDPQLATDEASLTVIKNLYEGLMKKDKNGNPVNAIAESYTVSDDGLTYNFKLKNGYYWVGKDDFKRQMTAQDFVFAFRRLVDPKTYSPYTHKYSCLKNAAQIQAGKLSKDSLGVSAVSDYELTITLDYPNPEFLELLAAPSSLPCNEEFFYSTKGKYGLEPECVIANGAFYLHEWIHEEYGKDNYLILRKNNEYSKINEVYPSGLNFFVVKDEKDIIDSFSKDKYEAVVSDGSDKSLFSDDNSITSYCNSSSGLIFNINNEILKNPSVRQALVASIDRNIQEDKLHKSITPAYGIIPSGVYALNKSYRELATEPATGQYNESLAQYLWLSSLTDAEKNQLNSATIIVPESYKYFDDLEFVINQWNEKLQFYCSIELLPDKDYKARLSSGQYYIALCELNGSYNSPESFLSYFKTGNKNNIFGFSSKEYDELLNNVNKTPKLSDAINYYHLAEKYLMDNYFYTPVFYQKQYLVMGKNVEGVVFDSFTRQLDFTKALKF